jgi:hypothetical protein
MLTFDCHLHVGEVCSSQIDPGFNCTGQMADCMYGGMRASCLRMSTLWTEGSMVAVGLWYKHNCILSMAIWMQSYHEIMRPIVMPFIRHHHLMFHHDNAQPRCHKDLYTIPGSWTYQISSTAYILTRHVTHWARVECSGSVYDSVFQFPPISSNFTQLLKSKTTFHRP